MSAIRSANVKVIEGFYYSLKNGSANSESVMKTLKDLLESKKLKKVSGKLFEKIEDEGLKAFIQDYNLLAKRGGGGGGARGSSTDAKVRELYPQLVQLLEAVSDLAGKTIKISDGENVRFVKFQPYWRDATKEVQSSDN
jgi:hypothetical protein